MGKIIRVDFKQKKKVNPYQYYIKKQKHHQLQQALDTIYERMMDLNTFTYSRKLLGKE